MPAWTAVRGQIRHARAAYATRRQLERELCCYNSPSDLNDLHAILDRYPDHDTMGVRRILASHHMH